MFKSDIVFSGYYGRQNTGDDAFLEVASWGASRYWGVNDTYFLGLQKDLPILEAAIKGYPFSVRRTYRIQEYLMLRNTRYLISAGGSTLHRELTTRNIKYTAARLKSRGAKLKLGGVGVSVGPFRSTKDEISTVQYLKGLDFLAVRDQASYDYVRTLDLPYKPVNAFDLAALLPQIYGTPVKGYSLGKKSVIGISVCPFESITEPTLSYKEKGRNDRICEILRVVENEANVHFKFFVFNGHPKVGDANATHALINAVSPKSYDIVEYQRETRLAWGEIAMCDFVLSTRLHASIFACFSNVPFMLNEYHRKCTDFLDDIGYDPEFRLPDSGFCPIEKAHLILNVLHSRESFPWPTRSFDMINRALLNFTAVEL